MGPQVIRVPQFKKMIEALFSSLNTHLPVFTCKEVKRTTATIVHAIHDRNMPPARNKSNFKSNKPELPWMYEHQCLVTLLF